MHLQIVLLMEYLQLLAFHHQNTFGLIIHATGQAELAVFKVQAQGLDGAGRPDLYTAHDWPDGFATELAQSGYSDHLALAV